VLRRYAPLLAVVVVIAVVVGLIAAVSGGGGGTTHHAAPGPAGGPLTFDEAQARGQNVNWGPRCDTSTGRVAVPFSYAPPCVQPWAGGDNGGATAPGVTADTITVALYETQPDPLQQAIFQSNGSDESLAAELRTVQAYADFFQSHYETYGRKIRIVPIKASGSPDDDVSAKADAVRVATELHAFASFGGPSLTTAYADELARRGVLCLGECVLAETSDFLRTRAPSVWPTLPAPDQAAIAWAQFVTSQLSGKPASHAGDPRLRRQTRRFGIVRFDDGTGVFDATAAQFKATLAQRRVGVAVDLKYPFDLSQAQAQSRTLIASLKTARVTSVVVAADPIFPSFLTKEATAQGYFPEWILLGYAYTDTAVFGRTYDQRQWAHAFGVSALPARTDPSVDQFATILQWQTGKPPEAKTYPILVQAPTIFFTGVHLAGPDLTAETFRDGLFRYPSDRPGAPNLLHTSWGNHGIWPGTDYTWDDDFTVIWWDPNASGLDEVGSPGKGLYRYALGGARYLPGRWPTDVGLYDVGSSITVLHTLTGDGKPPSYPSPASAPH
jgi:hypothetical protein